MERYRINDGVDEHIREASNILVAYLYELKELHEVENCEDFQRHHAYNSIPEYDEAYVYSLLELLDDNWFIGTLKQYTKRMNLSYNTIKRTKYLGVAVTNIIIPYLIEKKKNKGEIGKLIKFIIE